MPHLEREKKKRYPCMKAKLQYETPTFVPLARIFQATNFAIATTMLQFGMDLSPEVGEILCQLAGSQHPSAVDTILHRGQMDNIVLTQIQEVEWI
ncbi:hypothetical protein ACFX11_024023 [Malus domestica]